MTYKIMMVHIVKENDAEFIFAQTVLIHRNKQHSIHYIYIYISNWAINQYVNLCETVLFEGPNFVTEFFELGGISRVLMFLKKDMKYADYCFHATSCMTSCLVVWPFLQHVLPALIRDGVVCGKYSNHKMNSFAEKVIERDGIQILLLSNDLYKTGSEPRQLQALAAVWKTIRWLFPFGKNRIDKEKYLSIFDSALITLTMINENTDDDLKSKYISFASERIFDTLSTLTSSIETLNRICQSCSYT